MIRLASGSEPTGDETHVVEETDLVQLRPSVLPRLAPASDWLPDGYGLTDFELTVFAQNKFLKRSHVLYRADSGASHPDELPVHDDVLEGIGGGRNLRIVVALCLKNERPESPGQPFHHGHWLSSKSFQVKESAVKALFDVRQRSDDEWIAAGYPPKTLYAVEYEGGIDAALDEGSSIAIVYVHTDVHNHMTSGSSGPALQALLSVEMIAQVLEQSRQEWSALESIPSGTVLHNLARRLTSGGPGSLDELRALTSSGSRLRALLQQNLSVLSTVTSGGRP